MHRRSFLPILIAAALVACGHDSPTSVSNDIVTVAREGNAIRITNLTTEARGFMANDPNWLALVDLSLTAVCATTDAACLRLPAKTTILVPLASVGGYSASTTSIQVMTWRVLANGSGGLQAVADETITLKL